ncbi:MAG: fibronectin type III domain-containing protein [Patescibacteria group bacterium]|nr:fibronectin type III domain-containing protein [Patescibacteria group bacterium]
MLTGFGYRERFLNFLYALTQFLRAYRPLILAGLIVMVTAGLFYFYYQATLAAAASYTIDTQAEWEAGEYYPNTLDTKTYTDKLVIKRGGGTWDTSSIGYQTDTAGYDYWTYDGPSYGADLTTDGTYIYQIVGNRRPYLFRYNPETNTWKQLASAPTVFYYGGSIAYDAYTHTIFAISGGEQNETEQATKHMYQYDIASDAWSKSTDAPDTFGLGSSIASNGTGKLYTVRGRNTDELWEYDIDDERWDQNYSQLPSPYYVYTTNGQPLEFVDEEYSDGNGTHCTDGCLYTLYGNGNRNFFRFDIAEKAWYHNSPVDLTIPTALGGVNYGSSFAYDADRGNLFLLHGATQYPANTIADNFSKYDVSAETWDTADTDTPDAPGWVTYGGAKVYLDDYVYAMQGYARPGLWRYDVANSRWDSISTPDVANGSNPAIGQGTQGNDGENGNMVFVPNGSYCSDSDGCLYVFRGGNSTNFWRYNINSKSWTTDLSVTNYGSVRQGSSFCYNGANRIYGLHGENTLSFYYYAINTEDDDTTNTWTAATSMPSDHSDDDDYPNAGANASNGSSLTCMGTTVYALKGATSATGANHFFSWNGAAWTHLEPLPQRVYLGAALVAVPYDAGHEEWCADASGCVYAFTGNLRGDWYRYNIGANTWTALSGDNLPTSTYYTASLAYDGAGRIYATDGNYNSRMWMYEINGDDGTWYQIADVPARIGYNNAMAYDSGNNILYFQQGMGTTNVWSFTPTTNDYITSSAWISEPLDLGYVNSFSTLTYSVTEPDDSSVTFQTRTSTDKVSWSDWENLGALDAIQSDAGQYIQVKAALAASTDGGDTPTVTSITVNYDKDGTAPDNPDVDGYSDSTGATPITSGAGNLYHYTNPYFEWEAPSDDSGIAGYYVRWTDDGTDDPDETEDYFQTGTSYEVNASMLQEDSPYYLRIAVKDNSGNVSNPTTAFTYNYTGVDTPTEVVWDDQADFEDGETETNINTAANSGADMTLDAVSPGAWMDLPAAFGTAGYNHTAYRDSSLAWDGSDTIYALRAENSQYFHKYTISTKTWAQLTSTGTNAYYGASIVYVPDGVTDGCTDDGGCIFATMGGATTGFRRYDVNADAWTALTAVNGAVGYGGGLVWTEGDYLYVSRGAGSTTFYRYTISTDTWSDPGAGDPDYAFNYGASYAYVPYGDYCLDLQGCIFATRGGGSNHFYRYDIQGGAWSMLTAVSSASPAKGNYGATMTYHDGFLYYVAGYASTDFRKYDIASDLWTEMPDLPATHYYGSTNGMVYDTSSDIIYLLRNYAEYGFISFDVTGNEWRNPTIPHGLSSVGFNYGGVAYDGDDTLYIARGYAGGTALSDFYQYTISTKAWVRLADIPMRMSTGSDLLYVDGKVYALTGAPPYGEGTSRFYEFDTATGFWTRKGDTPASVGDGAKLVWDGNNTIYSARGANTTTFYSYKISGDSSGVWSTQASAVPGAVNQGGCAVWDTDATDGIVYMVRGAGNLDIYSCVLDSGDDGTCTWSDTLTDITAGYGVQYSNACTYSDGNIFVPRGNYSNTDFLVYDIDGGAGGTWSVRSLNNFYYGGRLVTGPDGILYGFRGYSTSTMDRYVQQTATTSFQRAGTWTSSVVTAAGIYDFGGLEANDTEADNTSLEYETRTCSDAGCASDQDDAHWSDWDAVSNARTIGTTEYYTVDSAPATYIQVRVTFNSDRVYTPTVNDFTLSYYIDDTNPDNPTAPVDGYTSSAKTTTIDNNDWANDATPYFEWTASDDANGIGVEGFYIYFGTDETKDPVDDADDPTNLAYDGSMNYYDVDDDRTTGSWDASTQSSDPLTDGEYYLRVKTRDLNGNVTDNAVVAFTFLIDESVPNNITDLSVGTYMSSEDDFDFSWTAVNDEGPSGIDQYCYHTGSSGDTCVDEGTICSSGTCIVEDVLHYQTRVNTFYVRAVDEAGNTAASYASTGYFYTGGPPEPPESVTVDPTDQTNNNTFTVSWELPTTCLGSTPCSASDILRYCYTINHEPSADTCGADYSGSATPSPDGGWTTSTQTSSRLLPDFSAATQQGENIVYIVAMDVVSNIDFSNYSTATYTFTSTAPGVPASMEATDTSDRTTNKYSVVLTWDEPEDVGSGVESYKVYRCESDCESPSTVDDPPANYTNIAEVNTLGYLDTSLDNTITYSYFARSTGTGGTQSGNSAVVEIKPEGKFKYAPTISGTPTVTAYIRSALVEWLTLNDQDQYGNIIEHYASSYVQYGTTTAYGDEDGTSDLTDDHSVTLTNLTPDTTYHYRCKWVDQDSNEGYSSDYTFTTKGAPSAPINLAVDPESNTTNSYGFTWDAPTDEGVTVAGYYYSINNIPNETNATYTEETSIDTFEAATQQGTNTFYVVAIDDGGNINYANYASVDFEAYTEPPSEPLAITITDSSDRDAKRYSITLTWDPPEGYTADDEIYYTIYRSEREADTEAAGAVTASAIDEGMVEIATITSTGYLDTGLDSSTEYFYQVTARDKAQATSDPTDTVSEVPEGRYTQPPAITKGPVATPDSYSATVTWTTERIASSFVEFGTSEKLGKEQGTADQTGEHSIKVTGLSPETKYYYRVKSLDVDENTAYSEVGSFTTLEAPRVLELDITDIKLFDAIVTWQTNKESTAVIQYGQTTDYGLQYTDVTGSYALTHTVKLEGLVDSATYHLTIRGQDRSGNPIESDDYSFTTLTFPEVTDISYENKSEGQTEIFWKSNVPTTSAVEYYAENIAPKTQGNTAMVKEHSILLYGLEDATTYRFKVHGSDEFGYEAVSDEREFTTLQDTTPPEIYGIQSESNTIGSGDASKVQIVISWKTDEPTTSQAEFGVGLAGSDYSDETEENAELVMDHLVLISDLAPAKTYHFRVVSADKAGNQTKSGSHTVLTSRKRESFLQLIISNLEQTFSWIGNVGNIM